MKPAGEARHLQVDVPPKTLAQGKKWKLTLNTSCGPVTMTLDGAKAPQATASAIFLARQKVLGGTPCHRVTTGDLRAPVR